MPGGRPCLKVTRGKALEKIQEVIRQGETIRDLKPTSKAAADKAEDGYQRWLAYTAAVLDTLYDSQAISAAFLPPPPLMVGSFRPRTAEIQMERLRARIRTPLNYLYSLCDRMELTEELPSVNAQGFIPPGMLEASQAYQRERAIRESTGRGPAIRKREGFSGWRCSLAVMQEIHGLWLSLIPNEPWENPRYFIEAHSKLEWETDSAEEFARHHRERADVLCLRHIVGGCEFRLVIREPRHNEEDCTTLIEFSVDTQEQIDQLSRLIAKHAPGGRSHFMAQERPCIRVSKAEAEQKIREQVEKGISLRDETVRDAADVEDLQQRFYRWGRYVDSLLGSICTNDALQEEFAGSGLTGLMARPTGTAEEYALLRDRMKARVSCLQSILDRLSFFEEASIRENTPTPSLKESTSSPVIFLGHGGSPLWKDLRMHLQDHHGYKVTCFEALPRAGYQVFDVVEEMLAEGCSSVVG